MAWSYGADPANSPTDEVHFLVGDTDPTDHLVDDDEIDYLLVLYPKPLNKPAYLAAAAACDAIATKFGRRADSSIGSLQSSASQQFEHYVQLAAELRVAYATDGRGTTGFYGVRAGGPILGGGGTGQLGRAGLSSGGLNPGQRD